MKTKLYIICSIILLLTTQLTAQNTQKEDNAPCDLDFARLLVEQQVADGKNTEDTGNRIKILIRSANFLWKFDEETARGYLKNAFDVAEDRFNEIGFERRKIGTYKGEDLTIAGPDYRLEVIRAIAKKDRVWADRLIKKVLKGYEKDVEDRQGTMYNNSEAGVLMSLAFDSLKTNRETSLQLYRKAMQYEAGRHWFWNLYGIWRTDADFADQIYSEALTAYVNAKPSKLLFFSAYPFGLGKFFGADRYTFPIGVPRNYVPNSNLRLRFVEVFLSRSERFIENPTELNALPEKNKLAEIAYIVSALNEIEPHVMRDVPTMSARFRLVRSKANASMSEEIRKSLEKKEEEYKNATRSFAELLERAEKAFEKGTLTDQQVIDMVLTATKEEEFALAEPWLDKIKNKLGRREVSSYFYSNRAKYAIKVKRLEDAEKFAKYITNTEQRTTNALAIAKEKVKLTKQSNDAELILLEVSRLVAKLDDSETKAKILLALAFAFEDVNHQYALDELSNAVRVINKLENPDIFRDAIMQSFRGEGYEFWTLLSASGYNFESTFTKLSKEDFQLTLAHAQSLSDKYFKTIAVLITAKNCIDKNNQTKKIIR